MNKCKRYQKFISDYIEGELKGPEKQRLEHHLKNCTSCSEIIPRIKKLQLDLKNLSTIETSPDFETVLRTRIRIESGIGRRRLHEIIWSWPTKIPVYGMSVALIVIATVLVIGQFTKSNQIQPEPYINAEWYGGDSSSSADIFNEQENVIYVIDRGTPDKLFNNDVVDSATESANDSVRSFNENIKQVNQIVY